VSERDTGGGDDDEELLDEAWAAIEDGAPEEALELLDALDEQDAERWLVARAAHQDLGNALEAEMALERAAALAGDRDADVLWARAEMRLWQWRIDEARAAYEELARAERSAAVLDRLALLSDLDGDHARTEALLREARRLDRERPVPARLSSEQFAEAVRQAAARLPELFRRQLDSIPVLIEPMPSRELAQRGAPGETPIDVLGLFVGPSALERSPEGGEPPAVIHLFQRNLERVCAGRGELLREIETTLYHELGHALGLDEDGVEEIGLG
jgi:predicted Zn-dependent protease with MMP-like domain